MRRENEERRGEKKKKQGEEMRKERGEEMRSGGNVCKNKERRREK